MDDRGNIYDIEQGVLDKELERTLKAVNVETNKIKLFPQHTLDKLLMLSELEKDVVMKMTIKERRAYFKEQKKKKKKEALIEMTKLGQEIESEITPKETK